MKKSICSSLAIFLFLSATHAQEKNKSLIVSAGVNISQPFRKASVSTPGGDDAQLLKTGFGGNIRTEYFINSNWSIGGTGQVIFFNGKDKTTVAGSSPNTTTTVKMPSDVTAIIIAGTLRHYLAKKYFIGLDLGGHIVSNGTSSFDEKIIFNGALTSTTMVMDKTNESGFMYSPHIGINLKHFQALVNYTSLINGYGVSLFNSKKRNISSVGIAFNYKL